jgi:translation initiation factor IF-3
LRINEEIRAREVRVVADEGEQLALCPVEMLEFSIGRHMDLVEIAPNAKPPVCRIMDYGKYRYEQQKREKEARKKQKPLISRKLASPRH